MGLKYLYVPSGYKGGASSGTAYGVFPNDSSADFDSFERPSFATRTNKDGLLETYQTFGNNLVINGDFATDSNWTKGNSSITISGGKANFTNTADSFALTQNDFLTNGKRYKITFTVSDYEKGAVKVRYPFITPSVSSDGVHTVTGIASSGGFDDLQFQVVGTTTLSIDDVSVKEIELHVPRIDYSDGGCPSLLLERQRTNLVVNSAGGYHPDTVPFTNTSAPDGTNTAQIPTPYSNFNRYEHIISAGSATGDTKLTYSWYRKRLSTPSIPTFTGDLKVLALVNCIQVGSTIQIGSDIKGYDRFSATFDVTDGSLEAKIRLYYGELIGVGNSSIAYFGHQVEVGEYATSYIPTSGAIATRNNDAGNFAGNFEFNSNEGVLEARFKAFPMNPLDVDNRITLGSADANGNSNNRVVLGYIYHNSAVRPYLLIISPSGGVDEIKVNMPSSFNIFDYNTYQLKFKSGNNELKINGELVDTDDSFKTHTFGFDMALHYISFNASRDSTSKIFYGGVKHIKVYDSITDF